jgi:hypothetical protein
MIFAFKTVVTYVYQKKSGGGNRRPMKERWKRKGRIGE